MAVISLALLACVAVLAVCLWLWLTGWIFGALSRPDDQPLRRLGLRFLAGLLAAAAVIALAGAVVLALDRIRHPA